MQACTKRAYSVPAYKRLTNSQLRRFNSTTEIFSLLISFLLLSHVKRCSQPHMTDTSIGGLRPGDSRRSSIVSAAVHRVSPHQSHRVTLSASSHRPTSQRPGADAATRVVRPTHWPRDHHAYCSSRRSYRTLASWSSTQYTVHVTALTTEYCQYSYLLLNRTRSTEIHTGCMHTFTKTKQITEMIEKLMQIFLKD